MNELRISKIEAVFRVKLPSHFRSYIAANPETVSVLDLTWSSDPLLIKNTFMELFEDTLRFDLENSNYWPAVFGDYPDLLEERVARAMEYISKLPPLLPIKGLRNLVPTSIAEPDRELPVLSYQQFVDTVYMYASFEDFLEDKPASDEERQRLPRVSGWDKVFDGLGAGDDELYLGGIAGTSR